MIRVYELKYSNAQRKAGSLEREIGFDILHLIFSSYDEKDNKLRRGEGVLERLRFSKMKFFGGNTGLKSSCHQYLPFSYIGTMNPI